MDRLELRLRKSMLLLASIVILITLASIFTITQLYIQTLPQEIIEAIDSDRPKDSIESAFQGYRQAQLLAIFIGIFLAALLAIGFARFSAAKLSYPIERVNEASKHIAQGDLKIRVPRIEKNESLEAFLLAQNFNQMAESLERYAKERRDMIASIAHDLRTPLSAIQIRLELLKEKIIPYSEEELDLLLRQSDLLGRLVNDLRTLSLADVGKLSLNRQRIELCTLLDAVLETYTYKFSNRQIVLEVRKSEKFIYVSADPQRLSQVIVNLLDNAFRFTPDYGELHVSLSKKEKTIILDIIDSGEGISEDLLPILFDRFVQGKDKTGSSGLGLAIVKTFVELHGGTIKAMNHAERGAHFQVVLPI